MKQKLYTIIFESNTPAGKWFDIALIITILMSVGIVMLDSMQAFRLAYGQQLNQIEWIVTIIFTMEFALRLYCAPKPLQYARSFFGVVDILSVLPSYISLLLPGTHFLTVIRILRVLRVFRILKFVQYIQEAKVLMQQVLLNARKIVLFILAVLTVATVLGSIMYVIEGEANGFTSIPKSIYWAVVTLTTVGYGDMSPQTDVGKAIATIIMVLGYSIIVIPSGFVTAGIIASAKKPTLCARCKKSLP